MKKSKKKSIKRNISFSLLVMFLLFSSSIIFFRVHYVYHNKLDVKKGQYNTVHILLTELEFTVNKLNRLNKEYLLTNEPYLKQEYEALLSVFLGNATRDEYQYVIYPNKEISYRELFLNEIEQYNKAFLNDALVILDKVDKEIENDETLTNGVTSFENPYITDFIIKVSTHQKSIEANLSRDVVIFQILAFTCIGLIALYWLYFMYKIYILVIKPVMSGHETVTRISNGEYQLRVPYKYHNEVSDLVNSLNKYIDISQNSLNLIEEQYNRLKLYSDIGEINYIEYSFNKKTIKIFYSKKFVDKYHLSYHVMNYSVEEYLALVHPSDKEGVINLLKQINELKDKEYKLDFRLKYPDALDYCFISTIGHIKIEHEPIFLGVQVDITYLKDIQDKLQQQEEQYRLIIENSTELIAKVDINGTILYASKAFKDMFKGDKKNINEYNSQLEVTNPHWMENVLKPPYSSQEVIMLKTPLGDKWISWNNDAILNENLEIDYIISVGHDITELKRINDKLKYDSEHDILTGLLNRRGLFNKLKQLKNVKTLAAFFIDVNNFKNINDLYGHELGDRIITLLAADLKEYEKIGCIIGRLSGDEFLVLLPNYREESSLNFIKNYLNKNMQKNYRLENNDIFISSSIGYALYPEDTDDFDKLISFADISMYESKISHIDNCLRFTKEMFDAVNNKVETANDLKIAIDRDEFDVYFQTIIDTKTQEITFVESLVRWNSRKGIIMPDDFLKIAEESGFMQSLDYLIIEKSIRLFKELKSQKTYLHTKLSLNVSPIVMLRNNFPKRINELVVKYNLKPEEICIEVSENTFVNNIELSRLQIKTLRDLGFLVALDDFGREYSSLSILDKVDFDIIKIDRLFIKNLKDKLNLEIINMIIKIARLTNNLVIAEGVENEEQKNILFSLGCYLMQGFLFSRPKQLTVPEYIDI